MNKQRLQKLAGILTEVKLKIPPPPYNRERFYKLYDFTIEELGRGDAELYDICEKYISPQLLYDDSLAMFDVFEQCDDDALANIYYDLLKELEEEGIKPNIF